MRDYSNYLWEKGDGVLVSVNSMTKEELIEALCYSMDAIEKIDDYNYGLLGVISHWRKGSEIE